MTRDPLTSGPSGDGATKPLTTAEQPLRAHPPAVSAARARRWGSFFYAEHVLRVMRNYGWSVVLYSVGQPVAYLFAMGVGLASLVDANSESVFGGVSYLEFVAPALLVSAAVMTASGEFSYPIMDGFKWRRVFYGPHASPLVPPDSCATISISTGREGHPKSSAPNRCLVDCLRSFMMFW